MPWRMLCRVPGQQLHSLPWLSIVKNVSRCCSVPPGEERWRLNALS